MTSSNSRLVVLSVAILISGFGLFGSNLASVAASHPTAHEWLQEQEVTRKQKSILRKIKSDIDRAGRLYQAENYKASAKSIANAQEKMQELVQEPTAELLTLVIPEYERLAKAHELLTEKEQELPALMELPDPMSTEAVSFQKDVAPILVARCGRCHINRNRGNFSTATFQALANSTMVSPRMADRSRLVEVLVDEEMPPGGSLQQEEIDKIRNWIQQGAQFDGPDPTQNLRQLVGAAAPRNNNRRAAEMARPTGKETVSFGKDVAPILMESCGQCHIETNRPRGNLSMANFRNLLRGGDSGSPVQAGNAMASLILNRMSGNGEVMPPSGKLDDKVIKVIETWIEEGAKFDGEAPTTPIAEVAAKSLADSQTHAELVDARGKLLDRNWKLVMSDIDPEKVVSDNLTIIGNLEKKQLAEISKLGEVAVREVKSRLRVRGKDPLIKGNASVFVFERRYDLTELGTMLAKRDLPRDVDGYWDYTTVDAYGSIVLSRSKEPKSIALPLTQQIAAIYVSSLATDVPRWFADGVGYHIAAKEFSRDERVSQWEADAERYTQKMSKPDDFIRGRMPEHEAGLVGFNLVKQMNSAKQLKKIISGMQDGMSFAAAFEKATGRKYQ